MQLDFLPRGEDRLDHPPHGREAVDERGHRIDEETGLERMPGEFRKLIAQPDAGGFERPRINLVRIAPRRMMTPSEFGIDGQENGRWHVTM
ncbi:hypothetical protein QP178_08985 [Sphingomonas aurantiaca]|uniref:hypothetical protein n=1 Tax=Sphingomonas aurantiaca TaxID=185949 RepID=UPI002FE0F8AF